MNKKDPRIIKTLRQIDTALLDNLKEHEFRKITVDMICRCALINRSTFYKYYKDKYDLLDNYLERILSSFGKATATTDFILASPHTIDNQEYFNNFRNTINYIYDHRDVYKILWEASIDRPIYQEMVEIIVDNIFKTLRENPSGPQEITPYHELYSRLFASNLMTLVRWWLSNENTVTQNDVQKLMSGNMKHGLFTTFKYLF